MTTPAKSLAAAGASVLVGAGAAVGAYKALTKQGETAARAIEAAAIDAAVVNGLSADLSPTAETAAAGLPVPNADGMYRPTGEGPDPMIGGPDAVTLVMVGDSTAVGYGCRTADELPAVLMARGLAAALDRPVAAVTRGRVGAGAADLIEQVRQAVADSPDLVVIVIGANDIRDRIPPHLSARALGAAVAALRAQRIEVVVGTCPDFGVIAPIPQPLRSVLHVWSRTLATLQKRTAEAAGGLVVDIGRRVSPDFAGRPDHFAADGFHPSGLGYGRAVAALLPAAISALSLPKAG